MTSKLTFGQFFIVLYLYTPDPQTVQKCTLKENRYMNHGYGPEVTHMISDLMDNKMLDKVETVLYVFSLFFYHTTSIFK